MTTTTQAQDAIDALITHWKAGAKGDIDKALAVADFHPAVIIRPEGLVQHLKPALDAIVREYRANGWSCHARIAFGGRSEPFAQFKLRLRRRQP